MLLTFGESIACVEGNSEMENVGSYLAAMEEWRIGEKHHASYHSFELTLFYLFFSPNNKSFGVIHVSLQRKNR